MIKAVVLFCAMNVDPIACTQDSALEWFDAPAPGIVECLREGQMAVAAAHHPIFGRGYEKVLCHGR